MSNASSFSIVVGLDFTAASGFAFAEAGRVARGVPGGQIHLVHVVESEVSAERRRQLVEQLRLYANEKTAAIGGLGGVTVGIHLRSGKPAREIVQLATDVNATLIVIGSQKGPHLMSWVRGSVAERLTAAAPCPVLVAGPKPDAPEKHEPAIEPPCPDCVKVRAARQGSAWWCERHQPHASAHTFSYQRELPLATHDSDVIPTGIDL